MYLLSIHNNYCVTIAKATPSYSCLYSLFRYSKMVYPQFESLLSCTNFTGEQLRILNLARSLSGLICLIIVMLILLLLIFYKAYKTTLQRIFLYITTTTVLEEIAFSLAIEHQFYYTNQDKMCAFFGFLLEWTVSITNYLILCKIFFLLYVVCSNLRGKSTNITKRRALLVFLEVFCVLMSICFPLTYLYVPFIHRTYSLAGGWCWIRTINEHCKNDGLKDQIVLGYGIFEGVGLLSVLLSTVFAIIYCRQAYVHKIVRHQHLITLRQTLFLLGFLIASVFALSLGFAVRIYTGVVQVEENYALWMTLAITPPIYQAIYPVGFLVYLYTLQKFKKDGIKKAISEWRRSCSCLLEWEIVCCVRRVDDHYSTSSSSKYCVITGQEVTLTPGTKESELTPLISADDKGYNSLS